MRRLVCLACLLTLFGWATDRTTYKAISRDNDHSLGSKTSPAQLRVRDSRQISLSQRSLVLVTVHRVRTQGFPRTTVLRAGPGTTVILGVARRGRSRAPPQL